MDEKTFEAKQNADLIEAIFGAQRTEEPSAETVVSEKKYMAIFTNPDGGAVIAWGIGSDDKVAEDAASSQLTTYCNREGFVEPVSFELNILVLDKNGSGNMSTQAALGYDFRPEGGEVARDYWGRIVKGGE